MSLYSARYILADDVRLVPKAPGTVEVTAQAQLALVRGVARELAKALRDSQFHIAVGCEARRGYHAAHNRVAIANNEALALWEQCDK
jgi:hypothetical protein